MELTQVKELNIDDLPCRAFQRCIDEWNTWGKKGKRSRLPASGRLVKRNVTGEVGIDPKRLLHDWRGLERRARELGAVSAKVCAAYWNAAREASKAGRDRGGNGEVWVPCEDGEHVDVFEPGGREGEVSMTSRAMATLVKECIPSPDRKAHILTGDDLTRMRRLKERQDVLRKRYWAYNGAFVISVEERLREFIETQAVVYPDYGRIMPSCAFLFSNEGRRYLVVSDRDKYRFTWFGGTLFHDGASGVLTGTTHEG